MRALRSWFVSSLDEGKTSFEPLWLPLLKRRLRATQGTEDRHMGYVMPGRMACVVGLFESQAQSRREVYGQLVTEWPASGQM